MTMSNNQNKPRPFISQMITIFPQVVFVELLSKWTNIREISLLDSSITNKSIRPEFIHNLKSSCLISKDETVYHNTHSLLTWLTLRELRTSQLTFSSGYIIIPNKFLPNCVSHLERIYLENCPLVTNQALVSVLTSSPRLKAISISNCSLLTDECLLVLSEKENILSKFESLSLTDSLFTDSGLTIFVNVHCTSLKSFTVSDCTFTSEGINTVLNTISQIMTSFICERCVNTTDIPSILSTLVTLTASPTYVNQLQTLILSHKDVLTMGDAMAHTNLWMPQIRQLEKHLDGEVRLVVADEDNKSDEYMLSMVYTRREVEIMQSGVVGSINVSRQSEIISTDHK
jgi:hypothetical protein